MAVCVLACLGPGCSRTPPTYDGVWKPAKGGPDLDITIEKNVFPCAGAIVFHVPNLDIEHPVTWHQHGARIVATDVGSEYKPADGTRTLAALELVAGKIRGVITMPDNFPLPTKRFDVSGLSKCKPE